MSDKVLIPHGKQMLALSIDAYREALKLGHELALDEQQNASESLPRLLTADEMASQTNVPASWWLEAAKAGRIPSLKFGKYRRFPASILTETDQQSVADNGSKQGTARLSAVRD